MSAPRELKRPDDLVILTVDIADSPLAELLLSEIYDVKTSTLLDDYPNILWNYILQQLGETTCLDDMAISSLCDATFRTFMRKENGDILSLRKPALQRMIGQIVRCRVNVIDPIIIPLLVRFMTPGLRHRSLDPQQIPSVVSPLVGASSNKDSPTALPEVRSPTSHQGHYDGCESCYTTSVLVGARGALIVVQSRHDLQSTQCSASFVAPSDDTLVHITSDAGFATPCLTEREWTSISDDKDDTDNSFVGGDLCLISGSEWDNSGKGIRTIIDNEIPVEDQLGGEEDAGINFVDGKNDSTSRTEKSSICNSSCSTLTVYDMSMLSESKDVHRFIALEPGELANVPKHLNDVPDSRTTSDGDESNIDITWDKSIIKSMHAVTFSSWDNAPSHRLAGTIVVQPSTADVVVVQSSTSSSVTSRKLVLVQSWTQRWLHLEVASLLLIGVVLLFLCPAPFADAALRQVLRHVISFVIMDPTRFYLSQLLRYQPVDRGRIYVALLSLHMTPVPRP